MLAKKVRKEMVNVRFKGLGIKRYIPILISIFFADDALFIREANSGNYEVLL